MGPYFRELPIFYLIEFVEFNILQPLASNVKPDTPNTNRDNAPPRPNEAPDPEPQNPAIPPKALKTHSKTPLQLKSPN